MSLTPEALAQHQVSVEIPQMRGLSKLPLNFILPPPETGGVWSALGPSCFGPSLSAVREAAPGMKPGSDPQRLQMDMGGRVPSVNETCRNQDTGDAVVSVALLDGW